MHEGARSNEVTIYNLRKLRVFSAIDECKEMNEPATIQSVAEITLLHVGNVKKALTYYFQMGYLTRHANDVDRMYCGLTYKLNPKGKSVHDKLSERFNEGMCLNLRKKEPADWTGIKILPGLKEFKRIRGIN